MTPAAALLPLTMAVRSLRHHPMVAAATALGVAIGMTVVCAILVVDRNTRGIDVTGTAASAAPAAAPLSGLRLPVTGIAFERGARADLALRLVPTQKGARSANADRSGLMSVTGAADYAAMRLAVRLGSLLAFLVGALIVFYTMRFSVVARAREFSLLLCLGQSRAGVAASLLAEAAILGCVGTAIGLALGLPVGRWLLVQGISTTGQQPASVWLVPWKELAAMAAISVTVAVMGVAGPVRAVFRMPVARVLQPRFMTDDLARRTWRTGGLAWLIPPALAAAYLLVRPFLISWLSVVHFFLFEAAAVTLLAAATLWWVRPLLSGSIALFETLLRPFLPLETLLTGRRMRLGGREFVFAITGIVLVFGMVTALHDITRALKAEIAAWADEALLPNLFYERTSMDFDAAALADLVRRNDLILVRASARVPGDFPIRLVAADDLNPARLAQGRRPLVPGTVILSTTLAARLDLEVGDRVVLRAADGPHRFEVIEIADDVGFVAENGRYADMRSYAVFSDGNRLFRDNLERTLGDYAVARLRDGSLPWSHRISYSALYPFYLQTNIGISRGQNRAREIDHDFLIFDFILLMTIGLAAIGVVNTLLIQVHGRSREFSVLRTIGMDRGQIAKVLAAEGAILGLVGALLAAVLGNLLGAVSVSFLDQFTLFNYRFVFSTDATVTVSLICVATCFAAALYPAVVANRIPSAESLHYE